MLNQTLKGSHMTRTRHATPNPTPPQGAHELVETPCKPRRFLMVCINNTYGDQLHFMLLLNRSPLKGLVEVWRKLFLWIGRSYGAWQ